MLVRRRERRLARLPSSDPVAVEEERRGWLPRLNPLLHLPDAGTVILAPYREAWGGGHATNLTVRVYRVAEDGQRVEPLQPLTRHAAFEGYGLEMGVEVYAPGAVKEEELLAVLLEYESEEDAEEGEGRVVAIAPRHMPGEVVESVVGRLLEEEGVKSAGRVEVLRLGVNVWGHSFLALLPGGTTVAVLPRYHPDPLSDRSIINSILLERAHDQWERVTGYDLDVLNYKFLDKVVVTPLSRSGIYAVACYYLRHFHEEPCVIVLPLQPLARWMEVGLVEKAAEELLVEKDDVELLSPG